MKNLLLTLTLIISQVLPAQNARFEWATHVTAIGSTSFGYSVIADDSGNVYTTGMFTDSSDLDPGPGTLMFKSTGYTAFIQKLDAKGKLVWARAIGGPRAVYGMGICRDKQGNLYVTGIFIDSVDFNPGPATFKLYTKGNYDVFILKLNLNGNFIWAKSVGGKDPDIATSISLDKTGNILTGGYYTGKADFNPGTDSFYCTSKGDADGFILKLDKNGNFIWAKSIGGLKEDRIYYSKATDSGHVYFTGSYMQTADFDPGANVFNKTSAGSQDVFIVKLDSNGTFSWAKSIGGTGLDISYALSVDSQLLVTGGYVGKVDFNPGTDTFYCTADKFSGDAFMLKLDLRGNFIWAKSVGSLASDYASGVATDKSGYVYVTGSYDGKADFDPGKDTVSLGPPKKTAIFLLKLDRTGKFVWVKSIGGKLYDNPQSIFLDAQRNIYVSGRFMDTVDFDPSPDTFRLNTLYGWNSFTVKFSPCNETRSTDTQVACYSYKWIDGKTYTSSNYTATYRINNKMRCDSVITLHLTIQNNSAVDVIRSCGPYRWINGITYTISNNTAKDTLINSKGCDSVVTLDLKISSANTGTHTVTACDSFKWNGIKYTTNNSTAKDTLKNVNGCDSIVTLNLTVRKSSSFTDNITACVSYKWADGITYTASNNTASYKLINAAGCDSIVRLNLTIKTVDTSVTRTGNTLTANATGATYQWLDCNLANGAINGQQSKSFTPAKNGNYSVLVTQNGCIDTSSCYAISGLGLLENGFGNELVVYPNPGNGIFMIELGKEYASIKVSISSASGQLISTREFKSTDKLNLEIESAAGYYFVEIVAGDVRAVVKVLKR